MITKTWSFAEDYPLNRGVIPGTATRGTKKEIDLDMTTDAKVSHYRVRLANNHLIGLVSVAPASELNNIENKLKLL